MELRCVVQQYQWGKIGENSEVAKLAKCNDPNMKVDETAAYAELWMGTHPNGPSVISSSGQKLADWITEHPECLGSKTQNQFGNQLPFLFKVLSIDKALSIQAHPDKTLAEKLHQLRPDLYKDANHKPELAIALTPFEALCGFRPTREIRHFLSSIPELLAVIGAAASADFLASDEAGEQMALKRCFTELMTCSKPVVEVQLLALLARLKLLVETEAEEQQFALVHRLHQDFPGDVGCFCVYLLNVLNLEPGQALYLAANEPHAYLKGDCVECMACSDNVVRAGLTPKFKDVDTLSSMLTYGCADADANRFTPRRHDDFTLVFAPPVPDFAVALVQVPSGAGSYTLPAQSSASIVLVTQGRAGSGTTSLERGSVIFLTANQTLTLDPGSEGISLAQAFANV